MTKLSFIPRHQLSITCGLCKHHTLQEVANLIAVVGGDTTAHEVLQRVHIHNCGVKVNNTYQIVYTGNSGIAMDGAGRNAKDADLLIFTRPHRLTDCCYSLADNSCL